jgi:hypothetical protein
MRRQAIAQDETCLVDQHERTVLRQGARRHVLGQLLKLRGGLRTVAGSGHCAQLRCREGRDDVDVADGVEKRILAAVADLNPGAAGKRNEEDDQDGRNGQTQQGLISFEPTIGRVRV